MKESGTRFSMSVSDFWRNKARTVFVPDHESLALEYGTPCLLRTSVPMASENRRKW
jgi:hypothetical protein